MASRIQITTVEGNGDDYDDDDDYNFELDTDVLDDEDEEYEDDEDEEEDSDLDDDDDLTPSNLIPQIQSMTISSGPVQQTGVIPIIPVQVSTPTVLPSFAVPTGNVPVRPQQSTFQAPSFQQTTPGFQLPALPSVVSNPTIQNLPGAVPPTVLPSFAPQMNYGAVPAGQTFSLNLQPPQTQWQQRNQANRTAWLNASTPITTMINPPTGPTQVPLAPPTTGLAQFAQPFQMPTQNVIPPLLNYAPVPIPSAPKKSSKKTSAPINPMVSQVFPSQVVGLPVLQVSQVPYDPTRQAPGESSVEYQRRLGLYNALIQMRLPNGQFISPAQADTLSRMRNNVDIQAVGYNQAAMQLLNSYLPTLK